MTKTKSFILILAFLMLASISSCSGDKPVADPAPSQTHTEQPPENQTPDAEAPQDFIPLSWQGQGNTPGNISNGGIAATCGEWIYYRNQASGNNLYKKRIDGTEKQKLSENTPGWINVSNEWVFYLNLVDSKIYRIDTNGKNDIVIIEERFATPFLKDNYIFYRDNHIVFKYNITSEETIQLSEKRGGYFFVLNEWVYYTPFESTGGGVYKVQTDGTEKTKLTDYTSGCLNIIDDWIYYVNPNNDRHIYKIKIDGSENDVFVSSKSESINSFEEWVFYTNLDDGETIYKIRIDGTGKQKLNNDESHSLNIIENWIYFTIPKTSGFVNLTEDEIFRMRFDGSELERVT
jgi:hypothetical protein